MVYPVRNTTALATFTAVGKWILSFGIPQSIIHDRGTAFINTEFINWTKELEITLRPRTAYSPRTNGKTETQSQHIADNDNFYERFLEQRTRDLNNPSTTEEHDSFPFTIEPLRSISFTNKPNRSSMHSNDSGITSPSACSRTPVLSSAIPTGTSTPHPSSSQQAQTAQLPPRNILAQFNNLFVTVPPAWPEKALNYTLKRPNITGRRQITPINNQY